MVILMEMNSKRMPAIIGAIAIIVAAALWGIDGVVLRPSLYSLDVPVVVFLEHFIAFALMSVFFIYEIKELNKLRKGDWMSFIWVAVFGGAIGTMAITQALFLVNFHNLSAIIILQKLQPLFAIFIAIILLKERPQKRFYLWAVLAIVGSYFITFGFNQPVFEGNAILVASLLSLLAAFAFGSSTTFGKKAVAKVNFRVATYIRFGLTSLIMFAIVIATGSLFKIVAVGTSQIIMLFLIAITTGGTAIFIYYYGLKRVMASKATIYELAFPITAVILDYVINKSIMSPGQWLGAALIIVSMIMITRGRTTIRGSKSK
jgi:drug/metabolite transporter (DMT)-like permease